jgi:hypothetical protein
MNAPFAFHFFFLSTAEKAKKVQRKFPQIILSSPPPASSWYRSPLCGLFCFLLYSVREPRGAAREVGSGEKIIGPCDRSVGFCDGSVGFCASRRSARRRPRPPSLFPSSSAASSAAAVSWKRSLRPESARPQLEERGRASDGGGGEIAASAATRSIFPGISSETSENFSSTRTTSTLSVFASLSPLSPSSVSRRLLADSVAAGRFFGRRPPRRSSRLGSSRARCKSSKG